MKKIILFLFFSFSALGNFIPVSDIGKDIGVTVFLKKSDCLKVSSDCKNLPDGYNSKYFTLQDVLADDLTKPVRSKNVTYECGEYCQSLWDQGGTYRECVDPEETAILNLELEQIYCSKILRYEQKVVGQEIKEDPALKTQYDAEQAQKKAIQDAVRQGSVNREKCKQALDFIAGQNDASGKTIEEIDLMMVTEPYKSIFEALTANRIDKARLELEKVTDPEYLQLKAVLIGILQ